MALDIKKNNASIVKAFEQVFDDNDETDWVLYGYEGQTSVLKVVGTGDGGIEEMAEDLSAGKMMYGYCRVTDPNSGLPKYVFVQWTGESFPENLKLKFTGHLRDVQGLLKRIHVTIPARCEEDVDVDDIMKKVAKSSGANYGFHKEKAKPDQGSGPVGSNYQRVIPTKDINIGVRDKFWAQAEKDETSRQNEERRKSDAERKKNEEERKEREMRETKERERKISEHSKDIVQLRKYEKESDEKDKQQEKEKWKQVQRESSIDEEERGHRSDQMRRERTAEAARLSSSNASSARDFFKQKSVERPESVSNRGPPPSRKLQHNFGQAASQPEPAAPKQPIQLPKGGDEPPSKPARQPDLIPEPTRQYEPQPEPQCEPEPQYEPEPQRIPEPVPEPQPVQPSSISNNLMRQSLPQRQDSDNEEEDQDWEDPPAENFPSREQRVPSVSEVQHEEIPSQQTNGEHYTDDMSSQMMSDPGLCAQALYDYQAADDTEITFDPGDTITGISQIDEGWWQGYGPDGSYGMFPANYVELIN